MKLLELISGSQNLKRYIKYVDDPLNPIKSDIEGSLMNENIILSPFNQKILTESTVLVFISPDNGNLRVRPLGTNTYVIDIFCPLDLEYWLIKNEGLLRVFRIGDEISKLIDGKRVAGVGDVNIISYKSGNLDGTYGYLRLNLEIDSVSLMTRN